MTRSKILLPIAIILFLAGNVNASSKAKNCCNKDQKEKVESIIKCLNDPKDKHVLVGAHRADWRNFPENSLEGIESAINMGVDIIELDLKMTSDSVLILMHDSKVDRTTTGKGAVSSYTLDSLKTLRLKSGCGVETSSKVPTLEEALMVCKDRAVVNIDQGYKYYDMVIAVLKKTGTTRQILIKGSYPAATVLKDFSKQTGEKMMYMPIIDFRTKGAEKLFEDYLKTMPAMAYEIVWKEWTPEVENCIKTVLEKNAKVWTNSMWASLCGGLDDDVALKDPEKIYGKHLTLGATLIQTDRPEKLISYLRSKGLHK